MSGPRSLRLDLLVLAFVGTAVSAAEESQRPGHRLPAEVREAIAARLPKYAPPTEKPAEVASGEPVERADQVLVLPKMTIQQQRLPPLNDPSWLSLKGRMEVAMKRYPGLKIGNLFGLNNAGALARYTADEEVRKKDALKARVDDLQRLTEDKELARELKRALVRPNNSWAGEK